MADDTPPTVPPKVTPGLNKPRPMTIRLKSTKPGGAAIPGVKLSTPAAEEPAPAAPAPAPAPAEPVAAEPVLEPITAEALEPVPAAEAPAPEPTIKASQTSRIPLSEIIADTTMSGETIAENPTIKLKPVSSATQNIPAEALKEASPEQQQAAKSKTARIALDSVLSGIDTKNTVGSATQKTIRLKRPGGIPTGGPAAPAAPAAVSDDSKTVKIKRPGITLKKASAEPELTPIENLDDVAMMPLTDIPAPVGKDNQAFSVIALIACVVTIFLSGATLLCLGSQNFGKSPVPDANTLYSLEGSPWPWVGN